MKIILTVLISLTFVSPVTASNGGTNLGPLVDCKLPAGNMDYIPLEMCRLSGGKKM